jgi:mannose-6-phosphate isomerase-like protein (cupin superfamily)
MPVSLQAEAAGWPTFQYSFGALPAGRHKYSLLPILCIDKTLKGKNVMRDYRDYENPYGGMDSGFDNMRFGRRTTDYGPNPFVTDIERAALDNSYFRTALWTGDHLQLTLVSINPGEDIGLEIHHDLDQFLRIEQGQGVVMMGKNKNNLNFRKRVYDNYVILIPAGTWHNLYNTGRTPIKLYSIYAPPQHPFGTVHRTKREAEEQESR